MAFAQLAEECRRAGDNDEAVGICRAGLAYHTDYLSARVTLGRALIELGRLDEAETELNIVLASAPDNLPANRALAEIFQQRGQLDKALTLYKRALQLAKFDPELEQAVEQIEHVVSPPPPPPKVEPTTSSIEDLFDFDTLLAQLGGRTQPKPEIIIPPPLAAVASPIDAVELRDDDPDAMAVLERQLRDADEVRMQEERAAREAERRDQLVMQDLEEWLSAIVVDRADQQSA
jgi:tetratricopeptide (TPR) repeat protein